MSIVLRGDSHRRACCITPAATCTEGPSRPIDRPAANPAVPRSILAAERRSDAKRVQRSGGSSGSIAALTCGIPDPADNGNQRRVAKAMSTVIAGVQTRRAQGKGLFQRPEVLERPVRRDGEGDDAQPGKNGVPQHDPAVDPDADVRQFGPHVLEKIGLVIRH